MERELLKKAKQCCSHEHNRLVENLSSCDRFFKDPADRHRCYRIAAKISGRQSKKCILSE